MLQGEQSANEHDAFLESFIGMRKALLAQAEYTEASVGIPVKNTELTYAVCLKYSPKSLPHLLFCTKAKFKKLSQSWLKAGKRVCLLDTL